ncbi:hypothetical protein TOPH_03386 [Tolypocladium ophioglossoides CBS 100239]|uniref:C2H2-type domain-containing protein n=1 Tax=Tolypocladium ophioglossoides (strain CBS 100239) TaxID=1163406 RepID=A0A0L0NDP8_TOLOC|nr:hypothetical protein TOPH_03386 [Tolypocladium ophioglossoides CBS 100239]
MTFGQQNDGPWRCKPCSLEFPSWSALWDHKQQMRKLGADKHISCEHCGMNFKTEIGEIRHIQQTHPKAQNLHCPGCGHGPFVRIAGLMAHIERGECSRINAMDIEERRDQKTKFARQLESITKEPVKGNYAKYFGPLEVPGPDWWAKTAAEVAARTTTWEDLSGESKASSHAKLPGTEGVTDWTVKGCQSSGSSTGSSKLLPREELADWISHKGASTAGSVGSPELPSNEGFAEPALNGGTPPHSVTSRLPGSEGVTDWCIKRDTSPQGGNTETTLPGYQRVTDWSIKKFLSPEVNNATTKLPQSGSVTNCVIKKAIAPRVGNATAKFPGSEGVTDWTINKDTVPQHRTATKLPGSKGVTDWSIKRFSSPAVSGAATTLLDNENVAVGCINEDLNDDAPASQWPTAQQLAARPHEPSVHDPIDPIHHPNSPSFRVSRYLNPHGSFYYCPHPFCNKTSKTPGKLISHLRSSAHGENTYTCPACNRRFKSVEAITSHLESSTSRCQMREGRGAAAFLDQLTGGIVNVSMFCHEDGTPKYETPKSALKEYGYPQKEPQMEAKHKGPGAADWW